MLLSSQRTQRNMEEEDCTLRLLLEFAFLFTTSCFLGSMGSR